MKICVICGAEFTPAKSNQVTCSPECSKENNRRKGLERKRKARDIQRAVREINPSGFHRKCVVCGKEFTTYAVNKVTCSLGCYNAYNGRMYTKYVQEHDHINTMGQLREIAKRGIHYGYTVVEMEKKGEL